MPTNPETRLRSVDSGPQGDVPTEPTTMKVLRERLGLTRQDLAKATGRSAVFVGQAEKTPKLLPPDVAQLYANKLQVPVSTLSMALPSVEPAAVHFRSNKLSKKASDRVKARATVISHALHEGLVQCEARATILPQYNVADFATGAAGVARQVRADLGLGAGPIPFLVEVLEAAGAFLAFMPEGSEGVKGMSLRRDDLAGGPLILVNKDLPAETQRHTIAHELGHLVLDAQSESVDAKAVEERADEFAGEFLAPYSAIRADVTDCTPGSHMSAMLSLRKLWGVHPAAFVYRAHRNGDLAPGNPALNDRRRTAWFQALAARKPYLNALPPAYPVKATAMPMLFHELSSEIHPTMLATRIGFFGSELSREVTGWSPSDAPVQEPHRPTKTSAAHLFAL